VSAPTTWEERNARHLGASLAWLRARFEALEAKQPPAALAALAREVSDAETEVPGLEAPALVVLARRFGLSGFERDLLLLCIAMELDPLLAPLCAAAQGHPARVHPTFALALGLFDGAAWEAIAPHRPLRRWRLVEIVRQPGQPVTASPLCADERVVNFAKGLNHLDERLEACFLPARADAGAASLQPSQRAAVDAVVRAWVRTAPHGACPVVQLLGPDTPSKRLVARAACAQVGHELLRLEPAGLPSTPRELDEFVRLWQRECLLSPWALFVERANAGDPAANASLARFLEHTDGLAMIDTPEAWPQQHGDRAHVAVECARPTRAEQHALWTAALGDAREGIAGALSAQFDLDAERIDRLVADVADGPLHDDADPVATRRALWDACRSTLRPRLGSSAQCIDARAGWDDIVLPQPQAELLRRISAQVRCRHRVYEEWGFGARMSRGLGISALFEGASGVGKTMAAEVIANDLGLGLYRIDLSAVVSKYIGETEENLRRVFDAAEEGGAILFFDECDALFGKRSEVRDSHDRYANIQVDYLLQRMESYGGLSILATNLRSALDTAFVRRLRFIVEFPFPDAALRAAIWRKAFPAGLPRRTLDFERLGRFNLAGGSIHSAALGAAFMAADAGSRLDTTHVLAAIRAEYEKLGKPVNESEFLIGPRAKERA
jgi:hypothetical protein